MVRGFFLKQKKIIFTKHTNNLRIFQHTLEHTPDPPTKSLWRSSFHLGLRGCLGYAPGVCWGSLRNNRYKINLGKIFGPFQENAKRLNASRWSAAASQTSNDILSPSCHRPEYAVAGDRNTIQTGRSLRLGGGVETPLLGRFPWNFCTWAKFCQKNLGHYAFPPFSSPKILGNLAEIAFVKWDFNFPSYKRSNKDGGSTLSWNITIFSWGKKGAETSKSHSGQRTWARLISCLTVADIPKFTDSLFRCSLKKNTWNFPLIFQYSPLQKWDACSKTSSEILLGIGLGFAQKISGFWAPSASPKMCK